MNNDDKIVSKQFQMLKNIEKAYENGYSFTISFLKQKYRCSNCGKFIKSAHYSHNVNSKISCEPCAWK